jgi:5'-nucleotidase
MRTLLVAAAALAVACSGSGTDRKLVIIHTNDEHSHVLGFGPEKDDFPPGQTGSGNIHGGASRRATILADERARAAGLGADSVTVSAGDNMMGTLVQIGSTTQSPDYRVLKMLGYDVTTFGNHEFDYGPAGLAAAINAAAGSNEGMPTVVSSNIRFSGTAADAALSALFDETGKDASKPVHRWTTLTTKGGIKIGFLGIVGVDAAIKAPTKAPVKFSVASCCGEDNAVASLSQIFSDLQPLVNQLRSQEKVDLVVLLSHAGVNPANLAASEDHLIAQNVTGIDVIVSGHTHTNYPATVVTNPTTGRGVLIQQAGRYGELVGRIQLTVKADGHVEFDLPNAAMRQVDNTIASGDPRIDALMTAFVAGLESTAVTTTPVKLSFLEYTLTQALGGDFAHPVKHDPNTTGDLYFKSLGKTTFTIASDALHRESQGQILATDAELWAAEQAGLGADLAVFAQGAVRSDILPGKAGDISFADVYRVVPLGGSPVAGTPGYPLCRFVLALAEIKGAFDLVSANLAQQSVSNNDYFLVGSGMRFTFDPSRAPFDASGDPLDPRNGRIVKIEAMARADHAGGVYEGPYTVIYDASHLNAHGDPDPFFGNANALKPYTVVTNLYVATLSYIGGVKLKSPTTGAVLAGPSDSIIQRPISGAEIKDWEALAGYITNQSAANGGTLPNRYDAKVSTTNRRFICAGSKCQ